MLFETDSIDFTGYADGTYADNLKTVSKTSWKYQNIQKCFVANENKYYLLRSYQTSVDIKFLSLNF